MRTIVALLIVSTFAYLAHSQTSCASTVTGGASCVGSMSIFPNQVTACVSGYLLTGTISSCGTPCTSTGCTACNSTTCFMCGAGYTLYATTGVCVALGTACTAGNATNATSVTCTACWANYTLNTGVCVACGGTSNTTVGTTSWSPVINCVACTATAPTTYKGQGTSTLQGNWVTCTQCANGFILLGVLSEVCGTTSCATTPGLGISTPECFPVNSASNATGSLAAAAGNTWPAALTSAITGSNAGCAQGTPLYNTATASAGSIATTITSITCTWAASGYWCPTAALATGAGACSNTAATGVYPTTVPANCIGGLATSATTNITCQWCTNSSFYLNGTSSGNACVANNASCITQVSATNCTVAAPGYTTVNGIVTACSASTTSCTGGPLSSQVLLANGSVIIGSSVTGCYLYNTSGVCVQCQGYVTSTQNCSACPNNCVNCTAVTNSAGNTTCVTCNGGFNFWSANNTCLTACANGTNRSSNGTCVYGKNMIASVVAFASLVFYYIF